MVVQATHHRRLPEPTTSTRRREAAQGPPVGKRSASYTFAVLSPEQRLADAEPYVPPALLARLDDGLFAELAALLHASGEAS